MKIETNNLIVEVMGSISFGMNDLLHEYEVGCQMMEQYCKKVMPWRCCENGSYRTMH